MPEPGWAPPAAGAFSGGTGAGFPEPGWAPSPAQFLTWASDSNINLRSLFSTPKPKDAGTPYGPPYYGPVPSIPGAAAAAGGNSSGTGGSGTVPASTIQAAEQAFTQDWAQLQTDLQTLARDNVQTAAQVRVDFDTAAKDATASATTIAAASTTASDATIAVPRRSGRPT